MMMMVWFGLRRRIGGARVRLMTLRVDFPVDRSHDKSTYNQRSNQQNVTFSLQKYFLLNFQKYFGVKLVFFFTVSISKLDPTPIVNLFVILGDF